MFLLDTDIVSQPTKIKPNSISTAWLLSKRADELYMSVITLFELRLGIELLPYGSRRTRLERWLYNDLPNQFGDRILPVSEAIAFEAGSLAGRAQRSGFNLNTNDPLIAATARIHHLTVATLNRRDFQHLEVPLVDF